MKIGFDLDKVLIDYPPFLPDRVIDRFYKKKANGILEYRIPNKPDQMLRSFLHLPMFRKPIQENVDFLKTIANKNNQLYIISSRYGFLRKRTEDLMNRHGFDKIFDHMYFNYENKQPHVFKNNVLKRLNLDIYVDDDLHLLNYVAKHNPKTKFFWLYHTPSEHLLEKNVYPITALSDIIKP